MRTRKLSPLSPRVTGGRCQDRASRGGRNPLIRHGKLLRGRKLSPLAFAREKKALGGVLPSICLSRARANATGDNLRERNGSGVWGAAMTRHTRKREPWR